MNKGIRMAQGVTPSSSIPATCSIRCGAVCPSAGAVESDDAMFIGDAMLDFGDGKIAAVRNRGWYIYQLTGQPSGYFLPVSGLKNQEEEAHDLRYKVSSDYATAASLYKSGYPLNVN